MLGLWNIAWLPRYRESSLSRMITGALAFIGGVTCSFCSFWLLGV